MQDSLRITFRVSKEQNEYLQKVSEGNISGYIKKKLFGEEVESQLKLSQIEDSLVSIQRIIDRLAIDMKTTDQSGFEEKLDKLRTEISKISFPPQGQMLMHESLAVETLLLLRNMASPEKMKIAQAETARVGYKPWESKR